MSNKPTTMPTKEKDNTTLYLRPVPTDIKNEFKAECARRGIPMLEAHIRFMRECKTILPLLRKKQKPKIVLA